MDMTGHIDRLDKQSIDGWFHDPSRTEHRVEVRLLMQGHCMAAGRADQHRPDLEAGGVGDGNCSFNLLFNDRYEFLKIDTLQIELDGEVFPLSQFTSAASQLAFHEVDASPETRVYFYPDYSATNYYQVGLYIEAPKNVEVVAGSVHEALEYLLEQDAGSKTVFHLHWTTPILAPSQHEGEANMRRENFVATVRAFVNRGGVLLWTIHNLYPHDTTFPEVERSLCNEIASLATTLLVHNQASVEMVSSAYGVSQDKIAVLPHGNYEPLLQNRQQAAVRKAVRTRNGIPDDAFVFCFAGQLRPYKGLNELIAAFVKLRGRTAGKNIWLIVAGKPVHPVPKGSYSQLAKTIPNLIVQEGFLDIADYNDYLQASEAVVCPYRGILTSGSIIHALSAGLPVVAPRLSTISELVEDGKTGVLYDPHDATGLDSALESIFARISGGWDPASECRESVSGFDWTGISHGFFRIAAFERSFVWAQFACADGRNLDIQKSVAKKASDVLCITVNYEHIDDVARLTASLALEGSDPDLLVVDSGTPELHERAYAQLPASVSIVRAARNVGYGACVNIGIEFAKAQGYRYVCVINPDMVVLPGSVEGLRTHVDQHSDTLASGIIYNDMGRKSVWYSGARVVLDGMVKICHVTDAFENARATDYLSGACIFGEVSTFQRVGLWPENYFLYFEETDWCLQAKAVGIRLEVVANAEFVHLKRSTLAGVPKAYYLYYYVRNALIFGSKYSRIPLAARLRQLRADFIDPWLLRIESRSPKLADSAKVLVERAVAEGLAGNTGKAGGVEWQQLPSCNEVPGHFDGVRGCILGGWVTGAADSLVRVSWNRRSLGIYPASLEKEDLPALRDGTSRRFFIPVAGKSGTIEVRNGQTGTLVDNGYQVYEVQPDKLHARVDGINSVYLSGWAAERNSGLTGSIDILVNDEIYCSTTPASYREDLRNTSICGGYAAFNVLLNETLLSQDSLKITLRRSKSIELLHEQTLKVPRRDRGLTGITSLTEFLRWSLTNYEAGIEMAGFHALRRGLLEDISAASIAKAKSTRSNSLVSIVMPAYNREMSIARAVASVIAQTHWNWELIIVDDGSTDRTRYEISLVLGALPAEDAARISVVPLPVNRGVSAARNAGLDSAKGDFVAYLDSDNVWHPEYIRAMLCFMEEVAADVAYCGQDVYRSDDTTEVLVACRMHPYFPSALESRNFIDLNAFMHSRRGEISELRFEESMTRLVDWEFILRASRLSAPLLVPALLSRYDFNKAPNQITATVDFASNATRVQKTVTSAYSTDQSSNAGVLPLIDVVSFLPEDGYSGLRLEQFSQSGLDARIHHACTTKSDALSSTPVSWTDERPTLILFSNAQISPATVHTLLTTMEMDGIEVATGRCAALPGRARQLGLSHVSGVLDCDLHLYALAPHFADESVRSRDATRRALRAENLTYAMLRPGLFQHLMEFASDSRDDFMRALTKYTSARSQVDGACVAHDPAAIAEIV